MRSNRSEFGPSRLLEILLPASRLRRLDPLIAQLGYRRELNEWTKPFDIPTADIDFLRKFDGYTMTSLERRYHLLESIRYVVRHQLNGAIVECGVWRGGSVMLIANALMELGDFSRRLVLYDTFEGMPPPTSADQDWQRQAASKRLEAEAAVKEASAVWAISGIDEVTRNMASTGYPMANVDFVKGPVEKTIPSCLPGRIALLRLDTDWYESTAHELRHLYPLLAPGGVVIIDDYGYWKGARRAVDEFLAATPDRILLHRIDNTGRAFVKPQTSDGVQDLSIHRPV